MTSFPSSSAIHQSIDRSINGLFDGLTDRSIDIQVSRISHGGVPSTLVGTKDEFSRDTEQNAG